MKTILTVAAVAFFALGAVFAFDLVVKGDVAEVAGCASAAVGCLVARELP